MNQNQPAERNKEEEPEEEKLKFLKRDEIHTMEKDITRLREGEAQEERERITELKPEEEVKVKQEEPVEKPEIPAAQPVQPPANQPVEVPAEELKEKEDKALLNFVGGQTREVWQKEEQAREKLKERVLPEEEPAILEETPVALTPKLPKKPRGIQKILVRAAMVAVLLLVVGFVLWYLGVKTAEEPGDETLPEETQPAESPKEPEVVIPTSFISIATTETLEVSSLSEMPSALSGVLDKDLAVDTFTRILIKQGDQFLGINEFFQAFGITAPVGLLEKLENDFTLFVYPSGGFKRLGFVAEVKGSGAAPLMLGWEKSLEQDTEGLFAALGKTEAAIASIFKSTNFSNEVNFRFLTVSMEDFGICYAVTDTHLFFTSSFAGMRATTKAVEAVEAKEELEGKVGQMFIVGVDGTTVTAQTEEMFKKYKPGGVLLLGKNIEGAAQLTQLTQDLQALSVSETGLPLFIAVDQEGGLVNRVSFAQENTPQSEVNNAEESRLVGKTRGQELKALGVNLNLAPVLDITPEGDFLLARSFQKDAAATGDLAKSMILGQKESGILTTIKHFPGYGGISFDPEERLAEKDMMPETSQFLKALEASPEFVMTSNVIYKELDSVYPFTFSIPGINFLKDSLGSQVLVMSDDLAQTYLLDKFTLRDITIKTILAGVDIIIFSGWEIEIDKGFEAVYQALDAGELSEAKINNAYSRIIKLKQGL